MFNVFGLLPLTKSQLLRFALALQLETQHFFELSIICSALSDTHSHLLFDLE